MRQAVVLAWWEGGMAQLNVVKIDLCSSKKFARSREAEDPVVRRAALETLLSVANASFPAADLKYPQGSFYKADGDAVSYLIEKPSVALRGAIEFMQNWFHEAMPQYPECRVFIDRGHVDSVGAPGGAELVGKPFENISVFEKGVDEGRIYLSQAVLDSCDQTMAKFVYYQTYAPRSGEILKVYYVDFDDPRTVEDTSLIHALFIAHKEAGAARERLFELFALEFLLERSHLRDLDELQNWAQARNYPMATREQLREILERSPLIAQEPDGTATLYSLSAEARTTLQEARDEFRRAQGECMEDVSRSVAEKTRTEAALKAVNLSALVEDYLCAVFSEIRMMANFFHHTRDVFEAGPDAFRRFDYILKRHLTDLPTKYFDEWRDGFLWGLRAAAQKNNMYIAAVFHNVLATYYLNRSTQVSPYEEKKLQRRKIFLDTNVLYSLMVPASTFYGVTRYFVDRLRKVGVRFRVFPFTVEEYEHSLSNVEKQYRGRIPSEFLVKWNPWLYQEFVSDPARYLNKMSVCRLHYSIVKDKKVEERNFDEIDRGLEHIGLTLEREYKTYDKEEVEGLWLEIRRAMDNPKWDLHRYWEFIYEQDRKPEEVVRHDVLCIENVRHLHCKSESDDLGPTVMFLTIDSRKLLPLRRKYPFVLSPQQFMEFILPYLFLSDIPVHDAERFPNQLLAAQLGTLLVRRPPALNEAIASYLNRPRDESAQVHLESPHASELGALLSNERLQSIVESSRDLDDAGKLEVATQVAKIGEEMIRAERERYYAKRDAEAEMSALKVELENQQAKIQKLQRTVRYWKQRAASG
jgi:hypothetical protein